MSITPQQWKEIEEQYSLFHPIALRCDGFKVTLRKELSGKQDKLYNMVYVNGRFFGKWTIEACDEKKFMYHATRKVWAGGKRKSDTEMRKLERLFGKEKARALFGAAREVEHITPIYPSFSAFKKRIISVCTSIELAEPETDS